MINWFQCIDNGHTISLLASLLVLLPWLHKSLGAEIIYNYSVVELVYNISHSAKLQFINWVLAPEIWLQAHSQGGGWGGGGGNGHVSPPPPPPMQTESSRHKKYGGKWKGSQNENKILLSQYYFIMSYDVQKWSLSNPDFSLSRRGGILAPLLNPCLSRTLCIHVGASTLHQLFCPSQSKILATPLLHLIFFFITDPSAPVFFLPSRKRKRKEKLSKASF